MDVFYYWKNADQDIKSGRLGHFRSVKEKVKLFQEGYPNFIWAFKTPRGKLGNLQLLGKFSWSERPPANYKPNSNEAMLYYDFKDSKSGIFEADDSDAGVEQISEWARSYFWAPVRANFAGTNGQHELRGEVLQDLNRITKHWRMRPLVLPTPEPAPEA